MRLLLLAAWILRLSCNVYRNSAADEALCERRRSVGLHVMERGMAMRRLSESLDRNHLVAVMCDQDAATTRCFRTPSSGGRPRPTKGRRSWLSAMASPLIPFLSFRLEDGTHVAQGPPATCKPPLAVASPSSCRAPWSSSMSFWRRQLGLIQVSTCGSIGGGRPLPLASQGRAWTSFPLTLKSVSARWRLPRNRWSPQVGRTGDSARPPAVRWWEQRLTDALRLPILLWLQRF